MWAKESDGASGKALSSMPIQEEFVAPSGPDDGEANESRDATSTDRDL